MQMTRQDMKKTAASDELVTELCRAARIDGRKDMAIKLSVRLDRLATEVSNKELSAVEIVDLLREESESWEASWH